MSRKALLLVVFAVAFAADTTHFGARCVAELLWLRGERAMFKNDLRGAWRSYERALSWGGNPGRVETDMAEVLVMGMDQVAEGFHPRLPLLSEPDLDVAFSLVGRRIGAEPFDAYHWSQASDLFMIASERHRRSEVLDLSRLSENPMDNLLLEERLGLATLKIATDLEPNNYLYYDLLAQLYMDLGSPENAAPYCRRSVAALPDTREHAYLLRADLPDVLLEAALEGFEEASSRPSMISKGFALGEAGRVLSWHNDDRRAVTFLRRATEADPEYPDSQMQLAEASYRLKDYETAIARASLAARLRPEAPWPHYSRGKSYLALGKLEPAIVEFQLARELDPHEIRSFLSLGEALESAGRVKEAERQFVAAAHLNPMASDAWASLLAFYVRQHNQEAALDVCSKLASLRAGDRSYERPCADLEGPR